MKSFDIALKRTEVQIGGQAMYLLEFNGETRDIYMRDLESRIQEVNGKRLITNVVGMDLMIVSLSLHSGKDDKLVGKEAIGKWPHKVVSELATMASELNGLSKTKEEEEAAAKNSSGASDESGTSSP